MKIVFSYDCEGNWGFVDWETPPFSQQHESSLESVYSRLIDLHHEYRIPATFAFVGLYGLPPSQRQQYVASNLQELVAKQPNFNQAVHCWNGAKNLKIVADAFSNHQLCEVGSHSLTHLPLSTLSEAECDREFEQSAELLSNATGHPVQAFIYPRNLIAYPDNCLKRFKSYRQTPAHSIFSRGLELARAVSGIEWSHPKITSDFVYAKCGARKRFSDRGWKRCWLNRLKNLKKQSGRTIHVWSHPHDSVSDPNVLQRIEWLMQLLDKNREQLDFYRLSEISIAGNESAHE